jgi:hypothetical protein
MSRYLNPLYDQFAAELNPQLKPREADIKIRPKLIYGAMVQLILRWCTYGSQRVVFLRQN